MNGINEYKTDGSNSNIVTLRLNNQNNLNDYYVGKIRYCMHILYFITFLLLLLCTYLSLSLVRSFVCSFVYLYYILSLPIFRLFVRFSFIATIFCIYFYINIYTYIYRCKDTHIDLSIYLSLSLSLFCHSFVRSLYQAIIGPLDPILEQLRKIKLLSFEKITVPMLVVNHTNQKNCHLDKHTVLIILIGTQLLPMILVPMIGVMLPSVFVQ